jgi:hypothetical protein
MGELSSRLSVGQHTLFFLSPATVLSEARRRQGRVRGPLLADN